MEAPTPNPTQDQKPAEKPDAGWAAGLPPELLATLGVPADQVTPESITNAITALKEHAAAADSLAAKLAEVSAKLGTLESDAQARLAAELDAELAGYDLDAETLGVVKTLSPEQRKPLLGKLPKKAAAPEVKAEEGTTKGAKETKAEVPPPKPVHDPKGGTKTAATDADRDAAVAAYQKAHPGLSFSAAWNAVRREQPALFTDSTKAA